MAMRLLPTSASPEQQRVEQARQKLTASLQKMQADLVELTQAVEALPYSVRTTVAAPARLLGIEEVGERLGGYGRDFVYELVRSGELTPVELGKRTLFRESEVNDYIAQLPARRG